MQYSPVSQGKCQVYPRDHGSDYTASTAVTDPEHQEIQDTAWNSSGLTTFTPRWKCVLPTGCGVLWDQKEGVEQLP